MRKPPLNAVWVHIDQLQRDDAKVWAVQFHDGKKFRYECVQSVFINAPSYTQFFGPKGQQPKAVIQVVDADVVIKGPMALITKRD